MSYYKPSFSQAVAMTRGRGFSMSYRGGSGRSPWGGSDRSRSGYGSSRGGPGGGSGGRFSNSFSSSFDFRPSERYSGSRHEDYHKSYRMEPNQSYSSRDHRSPERKRMRPETSSSHRSHDGFGGGGDSYGSVRRPGGGGYPERRSFSRERDRHVPSFSHNRDSFRKPPVPSSTPRGSYRGGGGGDRLSSRGSRGTRLRGGPRSRRMLDNGGYGGGGLRRRLTRSSEFARKLRINKMRRIKIAIARRRARERDRALSPKDLDKEMKKEKTDDEKSETEDEPNKTGASEKSPKKEDAKSDKEKKIDGTASDGDDKQTSLSPRRKEFIKLICPHCNIRCITFGKYTLHLTSSKHVLAMRRVANKQKSILARMRLAQRNTQRELEKNADDLAPRTNFCPLCKLNYKLPKATHQASDSHKSMKKFLMPYCKTCHITFKSPIAFETHLCSIDHIKRKARTEMNGEKTENESDNEDDLENFMTIDSVGELDEETPEGKKEPEGKAKEKINVGIEHISKVEVHYCELCKMYLPRVAEVEVETMFSKHCRQRIHMQKYIRYKEDKEIQNRAEKLQRKETAEKENREKKKEGDEEDTTEKASSEQKKVKECKEEEKKDKDCSLVEEEEGEDKLWADVDKDLGDILREAESGNKSSDEEDDVNGRYDRFKYSEKNGEEGGKKETEEETIAKTKEEGENKNGSENS
ncbi:zinc finger protein on ecdysone puffs isoform X2 [Agrilus planipennis]|uniref:Zinc finger protein on ecdysone puffs isoform X2 n=1 Tax=Agrilus planipennis TaxID=224129 RepID=A0A1W4WR81_AGRPL|nr:zinc finger protein on ecdysone puffs isoform X2 [Agrilus planipennis]